MRHGQKTRKPQIKKSFEQQSKTIALKLMCERAQSRHSNDSTEDMSLSLDDIFKKLDRNK